MVEFEWDEAKNPANIAKHGISFELARQIVDGIVWSRIDQRLDYGETRTISIGAVEQAAIIVVAPPTAVAASASSRRDPPIARKGSATMKKYTKPLAADDVARLPDGEIDYSDIPELDEEFWQNAELVLPPSKERITLRLDREVLEYFRRSGSGYQTRINTVLRAYVQTQQGKNAQR